MTAAFVCSSCNYFITFCLGNVHSSFSILQGGRKTTNLGVQSKFTNRETRAMWQHTFLVLFDYIRNSTHRILNYQKTRDY